METDQYSMRQTAVNSGEPQGCNNSDNTMSSAPGESPSVQECRAILKVRARALAQEPKQAPIEQQFIGIIVFRLASETYGIESAYVQETYLMNDITHLPGVPPFVLGITKVRGQILSVVDLKKFFEIPEIGLGQLNILVILRNEQMKFGILADEILGVDSIAASTIQTAPPTVSGIGSEYLRGVTAEHMIILDAQKILSDERIIVHQQSD
ncbi:MAG TPA: chemotaxis protein CheW [Desulfuromonadaceae bacterium]